MSSNVRLIDPATGLAYRAGGASGADGSSATAPINTSERGAASFSTNQVATSISPAAAVELVAARPGRRSVTITNITGAQPFFILTANRTDGVTTGDFIPGTAGASKTIPTSAAIFGTSP